MRGAPAYTLYSHHLAVGAVMLQAHFTDENTQAPKAGYSPALPRSQSFCQASPSHL